MGVDLPFDTIVINAGAERRAMTLDEFLALPLSSRIRHILGRELQFFASGAPIDQGEALRRLSAWRGGGGAAAAP